MAYQNEKLREFTRLQQGTLTVAQYEIRFNQLSRYAPQLLAIEQAKCSKFEEWLRMEIREALNFRDLYRFADLREDAIRIEWIREEKAATKQGSWDAGSTKPSNKRKGNFQTISGGSRGKTFTPRGGSSAREG